MLLKHSKKSADVSFKPPWAACKSLIITAHIDPLLPKIPQHTDRRQQTRAYSITKIYSILKVYSVLSYFQG